MSVESVLRTIAEHWQEIAQVLDDDGRRRLEALAVAVSGGDRDELLDALADVCARSVPLLPDDHPLARELRGQLRFATGGATLTLPAAVLTAFAGIPGRVSRSVDGSDPDDGSGSDVEEARRRLLEVPALSAEEVRRAGQDPDSPDVIRLLDDVGQVRIPAFQFDADRTPISVVLSINHLLGSDEDPWGVADWWLGENAWLDAVPARLIGIVADGVLLGCAEAVLR